MHAPGYLDTRPRRPTAFAVTVGVHAAVLSAAFLYTTKIVQPEGPITYVQQWTAPKPPPPEKVERVNTKPTKPVATIDPIPRQADSSTDLTGSNGGSLVGPAAGPIEYNMGTGIDIGPVKPLPLPVIVGAVVDPRFADNLQPPYPPGLERAEIEGSAIVRVQIGVDGRVMRVEEVRSDDPGFFAATRDWALKRWRFKPATRDGVPFADWREMTVRFRVMR